MDLFRMRCYLASLQGGELPNPKSLLAIASRPSKATLGRLGMFSVSSFHALVSKKPKKPASLQADESNSEPFVPLSSLITSFIYLFLNASPQ